MLKVYMNHVRGKKYNALIDIIFSPAAWISEVIISCMDFLRKHGLLKTEESPLPLISVGNLTYGGTNKTPFVEMLALFSKTKGIKTGIVTRGYTGRSNKVILIRSGKGIREQTGDEPLLLSRKLPDVPVAVAKHRIDGIKALRDSGAELVIADDAFQHKSLNRDADIVLIDSACPFGSGKLVPAGIMRENLKALSRADIIVLTKSEQVLPEELEKLRDTVKKYIAPEKIFTSRIKYDGWILHGTNNEPKKGQKVFAFSAIGNPESFMLLLRDSGFLVCGQENYKDHHKYTLRDLKNLCSRAVKSNADFMVCTEKDLYNLPEKSTWPFTIPLVIPKVKTVLNEPEKFFDALAKLLQPNIIIASNGYGEDAIGVMLARKFRKKLPDAKISAFPLVGKGDAYSKAGFEIKSAPSVTPSGGVVKYSLKDLLGDMRAGLLKHVSAQLKDWKKIARKIRTPVCVGDVYLLLHTLWGSGMRPMFAATAKTVYLSGHWRLERAIINKFTLKTWARDNDSALQLGKNAAYAGSPVMDLLFEEGDEIQEHVKGNIILLLPGSRLRACNDVKLLFEAAEILNASGENNFRMVLAPTLPAEKFFDSCKNYGWDVKNNAFVKNDIAISFTYDAIAKAAQGVKILIGFGGTANQLCAGLGIPVISIDEKGKRVQKKLLGDSEILVKANSKALAECALKVLNDEELYNFMSSSGIQRMGHTGALDDIVNYTCKNLGWDTRCGVYKNFSKEV